MDLTNRPDVLFTLLRRPRAWRIRAIERIELTSALWVDRHRTVEAGPLRLILPEDTDPEDGEARLHLPLGYIRQGPLPELTMEVAGRPVFLLPRAHLAKVQVQYLAHLLARSNAYLETKGIQPATPYVLDDLWDFLVCIFEFTAGPWQSLCRERPRWPATDRDELLSRYLVSSGAVAGWSEPFTPIDVQRMNALLSPVRRIVRERYPSSPDSPAENPLLALPLLNAARSRESAYRVLNELRVFLDAARTDAARGSIAAAQLVEAYAESGLFWQPIVECVVPLDEPFALKCWHREPAVLAKPKGGHIHEGRSVLHYRTTAHQLLGLRDAMSNHVIVRVGDPNVEIAHQKVRFHNRFHRKTTFVPSALRSTPEVYTFSASRWDRPYRLWLDIPLRTPRATAVGNWVIYALTLLALVALAFFVFHWLNAVHDAKLNGGDVAVILIPSAVAAALLLVRDTSTLSAEINKRWHWVVALVLISLWVFTLCLYAVGKIKVG